MEYDLAYKPLKSMKYQVVADFIVGHSIDQNSDESCNLVSIHPWKLFFYGSACREGQDVGVVFVSPRGAVFKQFLGLRILQVPHIRHLFISYSRVMDSGIFYGHISCRCP
jgi:hypothetical protein